MVKDSASFTSRTVRKRVRTLGASIVENDLYAIV